MIRRLRARLRRPILDRRLAAMDRRTAQYHARMRGDRV